MERASTAEFTRVDDHIFVIFFCYPIFRAATCKFSKKWSFRFLFLYLIIRLSFET
jgi:hypothetical protein